MHAIGNLQLAGGSTAVRLGGVYRTHSRVSERARRAGSLGVAAAAARAQRVCMARDLLKTAFFFLHPNSQYMSPGAE